MHWKWSNPNCNGNDCLAPLTPLCDFIGKFSANGTRKMVKSFATRWKWTYENLPVRGTDVIEVLRTTCTKNVKFKIVKIRTGYQYQYIGYFPYSENVNWAACAPLVGHSWFRWTKITTLKKWMIQTFFQCFARFRFQQDLQHTFSSWWTTNSVRDAVEESLHWISNEFWW